uniref:NADH dehydrogenase [ubiquinone] 1 beta subcomplex subunit 1 n=1 Tax=Sphenodon punctatus TaxID=8508 RepID=A0A8D0L9H4_SPHPU
MVNFFQFVREHWIHVLVPFGFGLGYYLDRRSDAQLTDYRNKSKLYARELKPGEEVTWR